MNRYWPAENDTDGEAIIVSNEQLDIDDTVTVYVFFPVEQLPTPLVMPTVVPGEAVAVLNLGVVTVAQLVEPPPPPPPLPFCADKGIATSVKQTNDMMTPLIN